MQLAGYETNEQGQPICGAYTLKWGKWEIDVDVNDKLDFSQDVSAWLAKSADDTIASVQVVADPKITVGNVSFDPDGKMTAWVDDIVGAKLGDLLVMTFRPTTANVPPRTKDFSIYLRVVNG